MIDTATMTGVPRAMTGTPPAVTPAALPDDPVVRFAHWLTEAVEAGVPEPLATTLATVGADGMPDARIVILRRVTPAGWEFSSAADARKAEQLDAHPVAALALYWQPLARAVRVRGPVVAVPHDELDPGVPDAVRQWRLEPVRVEFWQGATEENRDRVVLRHDPHASATTRPAWYREDRP